MGNSKRQKGTSRAARLEAELRANLKKRKEQARARARVGAGDAGEASCPQEDLSAKSGD